MRPTLSRRINDGRYGLRNAQPLASMRPTLSRRINGEAFPRTMRARGASMRPTLSRRINIFLSAPGFASTIGFNEADAFASDQRLPVRRVALLPTGFNEADAFASDQQSALIQWHKPSSCFNEADAFASDQRRCPRVGHTERIASMRPTLSRRINKSYFEIVDSAPAASMRPTLSRRINQATGTASAATIELQ